MAAAPPHVRGVKRVLRDRVDDYLGVRSQQPLDGVEVEWLVPTDDYTGILAAVFETAHGFVRVD